MNYALAQIYLLLSFFTPLCTLHLCVNFYYNPVRGWLCHHQRQQHPWPPLLNGASVVVVVIVVGSCLLLLLAPSHPPNMPLLQTTCNSFSSLGPAQKQSWENCFCWPHWGRWCPSVGLLSSALPILLLLLLLVRLPPPCSSWLALCCHGFQLHSTERRHTLTHI